MTSGAKSATEARYSMPRNCRLWKSSPIPELLLAGRGCVSLTRNDIHGFRSRWNSASPARLRLNELLELRNRSIIVRDPHVGAIEST